jgi:hypothetical protein
MGNTRVSGFQPGGIGVLSIVAEYRVEVRGWVSWLTLVKSRLITTVYNHDLYFITTVYNHGYNGLITTIYNHVRFITTVYNHGYNGLITTISPGLTRKANNIFSFL